MRSSVLYRMSLNIMVSQKNLNLWFSTIGSGSCLYHFSFMVAPYFLHISHWNGFLPIVPSPIFFLNQLTTFTHHMTHSLISLSKQPAVAIILRIIYLFFNSIWSYWSLQELKLLSLFRQSCFNQLHWSPIAIFERVK